MASDGSRDAVVDGDARFDVVVVGAGLAGLYAIHRFLRAGLSVMCVERASDVGGTWFWNRYPGARCDVESIDYSYSFSPELDQEWTWTERFATQPEILAYIRHVADRFDLRRHIRLGCSVVAARYHEDVSQWTLRLDDDTQLTCCYCVMATGCLSSPKDPDIAGLSQFAGEILRTSDWPAPEPELGGRRVAVIGTGSSGIQCIPELASRVGRLYVFQRTANFSVPARNAPLDPDFVRELKADYPAFRTRAKATYAGLVIRSTGLAALSVSPEERDAEYSARWTKGGVQFLGAYTDIRTNMEANETAAGFVRNRIREIVADAATAERLAPRSHPIGTKRLCVDSNYYDTFNRDNVELVDLRETPIVAVTEHGIRTTSEDIEIDVIVLATGFDAFTGALARIDTLGREGASLAECWRHGPRTYLGLAVPGFPNFFIVTGPGSPSVLCNMIRAIEQHVDWIADAIQFVRDHGLTWIEADADAAQSWGEHVQGVAETTIYPVADSWYVGANVPGKPRLFMPYLGGFHTYSARCDEVAAHGYEGFALGHGPEVAAVLGSAVESQ
jgi:cyclohexanone monooxygenase